jgi:hypothetical protein
MLRNKYTERTVRYSWFLKMFKKSSFADQDVFGPSGSGSVSTTYGSGSGFFFHQAKIASLENLDPTVL